MRLVLCVAATWFLAPSAAAQQIPFHPPRTPDGHSDFQGVWTSRWITPLERPSDASTLALDPKNAPAIKAALLQRYRTIDPLQAVDDYDPLELLNVRGELRSSLIVDPPDGLLPYTAEGRARCTAFVPNQQRGADDPEQRGMNERCLGISSAFAPHLAAPISNIRQIIQTSGHIVVFTEHYMITRIIPFRAQPTAPGGRHGEAAARWEDDTLAIESTGFRPDDGVRFVPMSVMMISPKTRITERFTYLSDSELLYHFTVEDSLLYTRPWTAETVMRRSSDRMFEFACHEGNYGLPNILRGARETERKLGKDPR